LFSHISPVTFQHYNFYVNEEAAISRRKNRISARLLYEAAVGFATSLWLLELETGFLSSRDIK
jgi:hypothetical protein